MGSRLVGHELLRGVPFRSESSGDADKTDIYCHVLVRSSCHNDTCTPGDETETGSMVFEMKRREVAWSLKARP